MDFLCPLFPVFLSSHEGLILPQVNHPETRLRLYPHQAVMLDEWERHKTFVMVTKTGTKKNIGVILQVD